MINDRARILKSGIERDGPVIYWMSRDQRCFDNWALLYAQKMADMLDKPLVVIFCLVTDYLEASPRIYHFMINGLRETAEQLKNNNIPFIMEIGRPQKVLPVIINTMNAKMLITDFDPLRPKSQWKKEVMEHVSIPIHEVDAHNIIPCWTASSKQEYGAYTLRPKIHRLLPHFLEPIPRIHRHMNTYTGLLPAVNWSFIAEQFSEEGPETAMRTIQSGSTAGYKKLEKFIKTGLAEYDHTRNDPSLAGQSGLSPYLHFGQVSAQRIALEVLSSGILKSAQEAFLEELIVRRELADNYCYYNQNYDNIKGFPAWAQETLSKHQYDSRQYLYSLEELGTGQTHDAAWNAAQHQLTNTGIMHGYMRMYWAKKILEWSTTPESALKNAITLNDHYGLDGRDPNGYAGIAWSIGGVHDRAWPERSIFGKIRYMNFAGLQRKFNIKEYIKQEDGISGVLGQPLLE